jgi:hypothetical protein
MKALVYIQPKTLVLRDEAELTPRNDEVLVRVDAVGICGSDMHAYHGHDSRRPPPLVLAHEAAGMIISGPNTGARVAVNPLVTCGTCDWCLAGRPHLCPSRELLSVPPRAGAFAELVRVPLRSPIILGQQRRLLPSRSRWPITLSTSARGCSIAQFRPAVVWYWEVAQSGSVARWYWQCTGLEAFRLVSPMLPVDKQLRVPALSIAMRRTNPASAQNYQWISSLMQSEQ